MNLCLKKKQGVRWIIRRLNFFSLWISRQNIKSYRFINIIWKQNLLFQLWFLFITRRKILRFLLKNWSAFCQTKKTWEIIFIDDGSTDESLQALEAVSNKWAGIRVFGFEKNSGQTAAFAAGFSRARGEVIITMDGDMQNDPRDIPKLLEKIGEYDLVCGWRKKRNDNLIRRVSSRIANSVRNILSGENIRDVGCSLKAFRSEYVQKISYTMVCTVFFRPLLRWKGGACSGSCC